MGKKLIMDSNGKIQVAASTDSSSVSVKISLSDLVSQTREKTKDVILATRSLKDQHLKFAGLKSRIAKDEKEEDKKDVKKEEKSVNDKVESLDALVEQLEDLIEKLDEKIKADAGEISMDELKGSDSAKEEAGEAIENADEELEDADKELVASFISKSKTAEMTAEEKANAKMVADKSTKVTDKDVTKAKIELAKDPEEAKKILEEAGEKVASVSNNKKEESKMISKEVRIANLKKKLAGLRMKRRLAAKFASRKRAEFEAMNTNVPGEYGASDKNDKANAKKMFDQANKDLPTTGTSVDKKWLTITANRISDNKIAKFKKALEIAGEAQLKDVKVDPIKVEAIKGMVEAGLTQEHAETIMHNAFVDGKQAQIEQLVTAASELTGLDNVKFVEAKMKISRYVPTSAQRTASIKQASIKTQKISTVVTGSTEQSGVNYSAMFNPARPAGSI